MLLHSGGYVQPSCYYPDPSYLPQHATPPPTHFDLDAFLSHPTAYQGPTSSNPCPTTATTHHQQAYYHHHHHHHHQFQEMNGGGFPQPQSQVPYFCSCGCPWKPVQETFLHKILTGKGYKNDAMCIGRRGYLFTAAGRSMDAGHFNVAGHTGSSSSSGADFAMAASCCYSGMSAMSMTTPGFPPSIPGF